MTSSHQRGILTSSVNVSESLPPQYDDMLPVTNTANDANKSDTEELVPETGEKYQRFQ